VAFFRSGGPSPLNHASDVLVDGMNGAGDVVDARLPVVHRETIVVHDGPSPVG